MSAATKTNITLSDVTLPSSSIWARLPMIFGVIGVIGLAASFGLGLTGGEEQKAQFYFSYLVAFCYVASLGLGGLFFVLIQHITRAGWSITIRRLAENIAGALPVMVVLFIPIVMGMESLYHHWLHPGDDAILLAKQPYLNEGGFIVRGFLVTIVWAVLGVAFLRASVRQDTIKDKKKSIALTRKLQMWSAPGLFIFALSLTVGAIDWLMTLNPHWFSTIFGVYYFAGSSIMIYSTLAILGVSLRKTGLLHGLINSEHDQDLGKMMLGFVVFWSYIGFSQYMLIWYANIPEETFFFADRLSDHAGSWFEVTLFLAFGHFLLPFFFLMSRHMKRNRTTLVVAAVWLLIMHFIDLHWLAMPTLHPKGIAPHLLDITTLLGIGGIFLAVVFAWMRRHPLVPLKDPRLSEAVSYENF